MRYGCTTRQHPSTACQTHATASNPSQPNYLTAEHVEEPQPKTWQKANPSTSVTLRRTNKPSASELAALDSVTAKPSHCRWRQLQHVSPMLLPGRSPKMPGPAAVPFVFGLSLLALPGISLHDETCHKLNLSSMRESVFKIVSRKELWKPHGTIAHRPNRIRPYHRTEHRTPGFLFF